MRIILALLALGLAGPALAAAPVPADWRLLDVPKDGDSASVIDMNSVRNRRDGKQARVAVIYDGQSALAAIDMTLLIDCAGKRERALSFSTHDRAGKIFKQGVSKRFEATDGERPWHKQLCPGPGANATLTTLGPDFPLVAVQKLLDGPNGSTAQPLARGK